MSGFWSKLKEKRHTPKFPESRGQNNDKVLHQFNDNLKDPFVSDDEMIAQFDAFPFNVNEIGCILMFYPPDGIRGMKVAEHIIKSKINPSNIEDYYAAFISYWGGEHDGFAIKYEQGRHWGNDAAIYEMLLDIKNSEQGKKNKEDNALDDMSYIADMHHIPGQWHQYDFLLASQGYGWDYIVDSAEYMTKEEFTEIGTVSICFEPEGAASELIEEFNSTGRSVKAMKSLSEEGANLGLGGMSKILKAPVKIVWFNQTRVIRIFTPVDDEDLLTRYAETMIRRTFGKTEAMKKARPVK